MSDWNPLPKDGSIPQYFVDKGSVIYASIQKLLPWGSRPDEGPPPIQTRAPTSGRPRAGSPGRPPLRKPIPQDTSDDIEKRASQGLIKMRVAMHREGHCLPASRLLPYTERRTLSVDQRIHIHTFLS